MKANIIISNILHTRWAIDEFSLWDALLRIKDGIQGIGSIDKFALSMLEQYVLASMNLPLELRKIPADGGLKEYHALAVGNIHLIEIYK